METRPREERRGRCGLRRGILGKVELGKFRGGMVEAVGTYLSAFVLENTMWALEGGR